MPTNSDGWVALKYLRGGQRVVGEYAFVPRANISLAYVKPKDVAQLYRIKRGCCGSEKRVIFPASEADVRQWENGGGR